MLDTGKQARDEFFPYYAHYVSEFMGGRERGQQMSREQFEQLTSPVTALAVGSPDEIIEKILAQYELFGHHRYMAQFDIGGVPFSKVAKSIELLATKVAPAVRREINKSKVNSL